MNKIKTIIRAVALIAIVSASTGCLDNFEDYNRNPNEATDRRTGTLQLPRGVETHQTAKYGDPLGRTPIPICRSTRRRQLRRICRSDGRQLGNEILNVQSHRRLAQSAVRGCHHRNLPRLPRHHQQNRRRSGGSPGQRPARGDYEPPGRRLRLDTLFQDRRGQKRTPDRPL